VFERLRWTDDGLMLDDLVFHIEQSPKEICIPRDNCFMLFKTQGVLEQYASFFQRKWPSASGAPWLRSTAGTSSFRKRELDLAKNMVELGIWDGGSTVLWNEYFQPKKYVAFDYANRGDSEYFKLYKKRRNLESCIRTYWGIDQGDSKRVKEIINQEFNEPLDLVIDDASHQYLETKASFETLFPLLRPGGLYIIEDWALGWWRDTNAQDDSRFAVAAHPEHNAHPVYADKIPLSKFVIELLAITGSTWLIEEITVRQGFVAVERSSHQLQDFRLDDLLPTRFTITKQHPSKVFH
jgi:hypothetical protein